MRRLFKMEVVQGRRVKDVVAFYDTQEAAIAHVEKRFAGWTIRYPTEIYLPAHFVLGEWETD
jgi:hypothetical protein